MKIRWLAISAAIATCIALFIGGILIVGNYESVAHNSQSIFTFSAIRNIFIGSLVVCLMSIGALIGLAQYIVRMLTRPKKQNQFIPLTPDVLGLPAESVSFPCQGEVHDVCGLYIPRPDATSTIIICPGYRRSIADLLITCKHMWEAGHNILAFEYYGHGLSVGAIVTLGYREVNDFLGAVAYATLRAPTARLGAIGYSMGAATSIMGCARTKKVEALVADSSFATQWSALEVAIKNTLHISLPHWFMHVLYRVTDFLLWLHAGYHFNQVEPVREISQIAPRPLLLIHGLQDNVVNPRDAIRLYEAAAEPKALWLIPRSEHIRGYFVNAATYTEKLVTFFEHIKQPSAPQIFPSPSFSQHIFSSNLEAAPYKSTPSSYKHNIEFIEEGSTSFAPEHVVTSSLPRHWERQTATLTRGEAHTGVLTEPLTRNTKQLALHKEKQSKLYKRRLTRSLQLRYARTRTNTIVRTQTNHRLHHLGVTYGSMIYRYRWLMLTLWIVVLATSVPFASTLPNILHNSGYEINGSESNRVDTMLNNTLHQPISQLLVVFQSDSLVANALSYQREVHDFLVRVRTFSSVTSAMQGGIGRDGRTTFVRLC